jgi:asparagine synthase (glutamine-hydrolysing)
MCGICGIVAREGKNGTIETLHRMLERLRSRGPDAAGVFVQNGTALGQRRLKIIDLSEKAQQPMVEPFLGLTIVYNGAIYNYKELREKLEAKGYRFFSQGDTEVVLKAFHAWGEECVNHFNGMFAFCIQERDSGRLFLVRDRLGIKPLYYTRNSANFSFASTLPALLAQTDVDTSIDPVALNYYMTFHAVVPAPHTIVQGIRKLPAGSWMSIEPDGSIRIQKYWDLRFQRSAREKEFKTAQWKDAVRQELNSAIQRRLTADVPVGVLLSGGLDSSLLVGLLAEAGRSDINTFSIGFEAAGGEAGDEFRYSDLIARRFRTRHHKIQVGSDQVLPVLDDCIRAMSEPMVSHDCIGFYMLSRVVAEHVKVVQSGQGADEVFGGYHWYPPMLDSTNPVEDYARVFFDRGHEEYLQAVHPDFQADDWSREWVRAFFDQQHETREVEKALKLDTTVMLVDDPVKRVDNMTMAWGLEARVPFLDHRLVELAARIPAELKVGRGGKFILKEVARDVLPEEVIDRPKGYFPVPALKYLQGGYLDYVHDILGSETARQRSLFNPDYVKRILSDPEAHITPLRGSKLWQVALLEQWLAIHKVG